MRIAVLLCRVEMRLIPGAEKRFELTPDAMKGTVHGAAVLDVVNAFMMKNGLQVAAKLGASQGLFKEIVLQRGVVQFLGHLLKSLLAVNEAFDK